MPELPPRYAFRLEDLRVWHRVEAVCACGRHRIVIEHARLRRGRPGHTRLAELESRLRRRCCYPAWKIDPGRGVIGAQFCAPIDSAAAAAAAAMP